jgi:acylpyruvate hydrolase
VRLATIRTDDGTRAVRVDDGAAVECGYSDVGTLLAQPDWRALAETGAGPTHDLAGLNYAPVIGNPGKIICVGLNYRSHITEMGRDLPTYPTLFAKFAEALLGASDDLVLPPESQAVDWEAELAIIIGTTVRRADEAAARTAIAGYAVVNDVSMRDWQFRTSEWLQGKTFEATTPLGPHLVTAEDVAPDAAIECLLDGEVVQASRISDLVFDPGYLVSYISTILTLRPGDVIATGTTGGVGHARQPPRYLRNGQTMTTRITGVGEIVTKIRRD